MKNKTSQRCFSQKRSSVINIISMAFVVPDQVVGYAFTLIC